LWLLNRVLNLKPRLWLARVWRPVLAATLMYVLVTAVLNNVPAVDTLLGKTVELFAAAGAGALSYVAAITALWMIAGRPWGAEHSILRRVRA
jgi:lipopolysaccharide exporter